MIQWLRMHTVLVLDPRLVPISQLPVNSCFRRGSFWHPEPTVMCTNPHIHIVKIFFKNESFSEGLSIIVLSAVYLCCRADIATY